MATRPLVVVKNNVRRALREVLACAALLMLGAIVLLPMPTITKTAGRPISSNVLGVAFGKHVTIDGLEQRTGVVELTLPDVDKLVETQNQLSLAGNPRAETLRSFLIAFDYAEPNMNGSLRATTVEVARPSSLIIEAFFIGIIFCVPAWFIYRLGRFTVNR